MINKNAIAWRQVKQAQQTERPTGQNMMAQVHKKYAEFKTKTTTTFQQVFDHSWTIAFGVLTVLFLYFWLFVPPQERMSDNNAKMGAGISLLCAIISELSQYQSSIIKTQVVVKNQQVERDQRFTQEQMKSSLQDMLNQENQKRTLNQLNVQSKQQPKLENSLFAHAPDSWSKNNGNLRKRQNMNVTQYHDEPEWQPIVGIDTSRIEISAQQKFNYKHDKSQENPCTLPYFKADQHKQEENDRQASIFMKRELNTHNDQVHEFCERTKYYIFNHLFSELLNLYLDRVKAIVNFVNSECGMRVAPDVEDFNDLINEELAIFQHQGHFKTQHGLKPTEIKIRDLRQRSEQLIEIRKLNNKDKEQFKGLCADLNDVYRIFNAVSNVSHTYFDKVPFVIKRIEAMIRDPQQEYNHRGSGISQLDNATQKQLSGTFYNGQRWRVGAGLPSDSEIVAAVFCAQMQSWTGSQTKNLFDYNLTPYGMNTMKWFDIGMVNTQPVNHRPHYELFANKKNHPMPYGEHNIWYTIMMVHASIYYLSYCKKQQENRPQGFSTVAKYGEFECHDAINFIFKSQLGNLEDLIMFDFRANKSVKITV